MPCSLVFVRTGTTMALRSTSLHFCRAPKTLVKPSLLALLVAKNQHAAFRSLQHCHVFSHSRRHGLVTCLGAATRTRRSDWKPVSLPCLEQRTSNYGRYAYQDVSSDDSDREFGSTKQQACGSTLENIDEWRWKLTMLLRNKDEQELVSRERKDRRDFEQLSTLATRMGLHSRQYVKVVAFSKVPLPNYRSDLDDKRPQREHYTVTTSFCPEYFFDTKELRRMAGNRKSDL